MADHLDLGELREAGEVVAQEGGRELAGEVHLGHVEGRERGADPPRAAALEEQRLLPREAARRVADGLGAARVRAPLGHAASTSASRSICARVVSSVAQTRSAPASSGA